MWLFYCLFGFIGFCFIYDRLTINYVNTYKLIMVFGKKGSGKTTYLTKQALKHISSGWIVYSTVPIPGTIYFNVDDIGKFTFPKNSLVLIDEVGMIWDNRNFKNFKTNVRDYFKLQRHWGNKVIMFSQTFDVDKKLRDLTDEMYLLKNVGRVFSVARKINKNITIQNGGETYTSTLADEYVYAPILSHNGLQLTWIPRYVDFFDSFEVDPLPYVTGMKCEFSEEQLGLIRNTDFAFMKITDWLSKLLYSFKTPNFFKKRK